MSEKVRKGIVFGIFIIALIWGYSTFSERWSKQKENATQQNTPKTIQPLTQSDIRDIGQNQATGSDMFEAFEKKEIGKNPFYHNYKSTSSTSVSGDADLHLMGILYREAKAQALINNKVVGEGDSFSGYKVEKITNEKVVLSSKSGQVTLWPRKGTS